MRIHYSANSWHAAISENITRELRLLGHDVCFFEQNLSGSFRVMRNLARRLAPTPYKVENFFAGIIGKKWLASIGAYKPDVIFIEDSPFILAEFVKEARKFKKPIVYFEHSPPQTGGSRDVLASFEHVDLMFCLDKEWFKYISYFFRGKIYHLPFAGDPHHFRPLGNVEKIYDLTFVGSAAPQDGDGLIRARLLASVPEKFKVGIFGNGWDYWPRYFPGLKKRVFSTRAISDEEVNSVYNKSKIGLGYTSWSQPSSIPQRVFNMSLAGCFQLVQPRADFDEMFPAKSFVSYGDPDDLARLVEYWVQREAERNKETEKVRNYVLQHHAWRHRVQFLLEKLNAHMAPK